MWKWLLGGFLVMVLVCAGGGVFVATNKGIRKQIDDMIPRPKPTTVRIEAASVSALSRTISAPGQIEAKTHVQISAQVSARIIALPFRENEDVKKGDVIVRLDSRDLVAILDQSKANLLGEQARLEGTQASLTRATADRERVKKLVASGDKTQADLEQSEAEYLRAQSNLSAAQSAVAASRAQIVRAEKDLENAVISSPIDGTITRLNAEVGELVVVGTLNNAGSVIMEIADLTRMLVKARVDESNILPVKENQAAKVYINAYGERVFTGKVERIELQRRVDRDNTGYFEVWIPVDLENGETLRSGLTANTDIEVETLRDVLVVPSQAVVDRKIDELPKSVTQNNPQVTLTNTFARVVFKVVETEGEKKTAADGSPFVKVIAVPVGVGSSDLTRTVVLAGLKAGDRVVAGPFKVLVALKHDQEVVEEGTATIKPGEKPANDATEKDKSASAKLAPPPPPEKKDPKSPPTPPNGPKPKEGA